MKTGEGGCYFFAVITLCFSLLRSVSSRMSYRSKLLKNVIMFKVMFLFISDGLMSSGKVYFVTIYFIFIPDVINESQTLAIYCGRRVNFIVHGKHAKFFQGKGHSCSFLTVNANKKSYNKNEILNADDLSVIIIPLLSSFKQIDRNRLNQSLKEEWLKNKSI